MFCCLFWFLTKKRGGGFSGLLKNLKKTSLSDKICLRLVLPRAARFAGKTVHPSMRTNARRPKSNSKRRLPRKTAGDASIAPSRARVVVDRRRDSSTHVPPCIQKKREERDKKKGATERTYRFGDDRRSFLGCRHRSRRRRRDPRVAARAARR